ncbi:MAG: anthranilate synthase component I family protein [bacterium]|nr:anthranilate synthase component I family protein [bacterium]
MTKPIQLFNELKKQGMRPALLESNGTPSHFSNKTILGCNYTQKLEIKNGVLFYNDKNAGKALDIFNFFKLPKSKTFFPAWIGFFSYEFAKYCNLPTNSSDNETPEACFFLYEEGFFWQAKKLIEKPKQNIFNETLNNEHIKEVKLNCDFSEEEFKNGVIEIKNKIINGEVYQVNLSQQHNFDGKNTDPVLAYNNLVETNPSPFMGIIGDENWTIVSGSPERLFKYDQQIIETRPIAGTRPRGKNSEQEKIFEMDLRTNRKELAEHSMLVDLLRNDLAKVSIPGSTFVNEAFTIEYYSHVMHLVSEVKSKSEASLKEIFVSIFPGGTITGTPKESAMQCIADIETIPRGAYTGSLGFVSSGHGADFNILIRSLFFTKKLAYFTTGAGIVSESDPVKEYEEVEQIKLKAFAIYYMIRQKAAK